MESAEMVVGVDITYYQRLRGWPGWATMLGQEEFSHAADGVPIPVAAKLTSWKTGA
jgi:hypothetical protein